MANLYGMDSDRFEKLLAAFRDARDGKSGPARDMCKGVELPGFTVEEALADGTGPKAGQLFRAIAVATCRGEESLEGCDVKDVRNALAELLKSPCNACEASAVDQFLPPRYDGSQKGKGKLGAISWLSHIVNRGTAWPGSGIPYYIPNPEVPELFGELSPTEVKYDGSPQGKVVRRFYDFVEAMMIVGEGGFQLEEGGGVGGESTGFADGRER